MPSSPDTDHPDDCHRVRAALDAAKFTYADISAALASKDLKVPDASELPILLHRTSGKTPLGTLIRLFVLGVPVVRRSLLTYGLPDFTALGPRSANDRNRVRRSIEQAIALFEPRLERVRVTLLPAREHDQAIRFYIDAFLRVEPTPEPITFDAVLRLNTQQYTVRRRE